MIDVGYSGVIGAHKILHGQTLYGHFPKDDPHGDTYGPVNYLAYVPVRRRCSAGAGTGTTSPPPTAPR